MRTKAIVAGVVLSAVLAAGCSSDDDDAASDDTSDSTSTTSAPGDDATGTPDDDEEGTGSGVDDGTDDTGSDAGPGGAACDLLTVEEVAAATSVDVELTSEERGGDTVCIYTDAAGAVLGELQVTDASNVTTVIESAGSGAYADLVVVEGVGTGLAVSDAGLQAYLAVDDQGFIFTTLSPEVVDAGQLEDLMRNIVAG